MILSWRVFLIELVRIERFCTIFLNSRFICSVVVPVESVCETNLSNPVTVAVAKFRLEVWIAILLYVCKIWKYAPVAKLFNVICKLVILDTDTSRWVSVLVEIDCVTVLDNENKF